MKQVIYDRRLFVGKKRKKKKSMLYVQAISVTLLNHSRWSLFFLLITHSFSLFFLTSILAKGNRKHQWPKSTFPTINLAVASFRPLDLLTFPVFITRCISPWCRGPRFYSPLAIFWEPPFTHTRMRWQLNSWEELQFVEFYGCRRSPAAPDRLRLTGTMKSEIVGGAENGPSTTYGHDTFSWVRALRSMSRYILEDILQ